MSKQSDAGTVFAFGATVDVTIPHVTVPLAGYTVELVGGIAHRRRNYDLDETQLLLKVTQPHLTADSYQSIMTALAPIPGVLGPNADIAEDGAMSMEVAIPVTNANVGLTWRITTELQLTYLGRHGSTLALNGPDDAVVLDHRGAWHLLEAIVTWNVVHKKLLKAAHQTYDTQLAGLCASLDGRLGRPSQKRS